MLNVTFTATSFTDLSKKNSDIQPNEAIVVLTNDKLELNNAILNIFTADRFHDGAGNAAGSLDKMLRDNNLKFKGEYGEAKIFTNLIRADRLFSLIICSFGNETNLREGFIEKIGGKIYKHAASLQVSKITIIAGKAGIYKPSQVGALLGSGCLLASYRFEKYKTSQKPEEKTNLNNVVINIVDMDVQKTDVQKAEELFAAKTAIARGVFFARDCINEAPNILYPESYAERVINELEPLGIDIKMLNERDMRELGMGALLGVGQGSARESRLLVLQYHGGSSEQLPVCLVGKGVTFDTGGISIKPAANMWDMKYDMSGAAAVIGVIHAAALRKAKVNIVVVAGLAENMPGGKAQRPGDIVTTMSGKTVEVLNTDAEGRLVLSDCITYLLQNFTPDYVIDVATLTGAILISLANSYAGCFTHDDELAAKLINSAASVEEKLWRMPLHKDFDEMLESQVADLANISTSGMAGSSIAAHFIGRFTDKARWAHLDIAGMAWDKTGKNDLCPKGAVGFGIRLLNRFIEDNYETK